MYLFVDASKEALLLFSLSKALVLLQLKEGAKRGVAVSAGGADGLPHLRWPSGRGEVAETAALSPVGGVGPSRSRFWCPVAAASRRRRWRRHIGIRSSRTSPRLGGAMLRRRRRVRGGGVRLCRPLYRSLGGLRLRRFGGGGGGDIPRQGYSDNCGRSGSLESGSSLCSQDACRRQASIQVWRSMGRDPGRCSFIVILIPASASGGFCGSSQSFIAMVLLQIWASQGGFFFDGGNRRLIDGGGRRRRKLLAKARITRSRDFSAICFFAKGLCVSSMVQVSMYPPRMYLCLYTFLYVFLIW
jgi:hypothetical protein